MTTPEQLTKFRETACEAALRAAAVLDDWRTRFQVREKGRFDLVTEADLASQQTIFAFLQEHFPEHAFLGEEQSHGQGRPGLDAPPTWIVDPLDGTTNYVHDCPLYCVSIGLQIAGELVVGVVYDPSRREMFHAARGQGAFLGQQRLKTSTIQTLEESLLGIGFPPDMQGQQKSMLCWQHFAPRAQSLRRTGSTALNLAYVAAGRFDGFWGMDNHVWDVAGGVVLVQEAGGIVTKMDGSAYDPYAPDALASNGRIHQIMVQELNTLF